MLTTTGEASSFFLSESIPKLDTARHAEAGKPLRWRAPVRPKASAGGSQPDRYRGQSGRTPAGRALRWDGSFRYPQSGSYPHPPRNAEIREEWPSLGQRQLALKYALTARQVRKILAAEEPEEPEQMGLF
ncbi:hypothetical protein [Nitrosomonas sp. Nm58]|uniref:hypothetical protein n=1 Tax=Nitrosomonas sp. Nm58 TaxID=200126 RepID=UPI000B85A1A3|nr:hypothetical protein [Nitrosomonas sp. Nm58]